ncbi:MAG: hypothetical protein AAF191_11860, partial [Verrucomicrobiota bacterium]
MINRSSIGYLILGFVICSPAGLQAEGGPSALEALRKLAERMYQQPSIIELRGERGQDQPEEWTAIIFDGQSPNFGREFRIDGLTVSDEGIPRGLYPTHLPAGFMPQSELRVDSSQAFRTLNAEAAQARIGFNSVDYLLTAEGRNGGPLWRLAAVDVKGRTVGHVEVSGVDGQATRTVW